MENTHGRPQILHDLGKGIIAGFWETGDMLVHREMNLGQRFMRAKSHEVERLQSEDHPKDRKQAVDKAYTQNEPEPGGTAYNVGYGLGKIGGYIAYTLG